MGTARLAFNRHAPASLAWWLLCRDLGLVGAKLRAVTSTALGVELAIDLSLPTTGSAVERELPSLAVAFGVARARLRLGETARQVYVLLDQATSLGYLPYPQPRRDPIGLPARSTSPIVVGADDHGDPVSWTLYGEHLLVGGTPGAGKSNVLRVLLAGLAEKRDTSIVLIDPKHAEASMWRRRATRVVTGNEAAPLVTLLEELLSEIQRRAALLAAMEKGLLLPAPEHPWIVVVVDEWAEAGAAGSSKERQDIADKLRRVASLGRAVGCTVVLATQRPTADVIDTSTRALMTRRVALRCVDKWTAEAILGQGVATSQQLGRADAGQALCSDGGPAALVQFFHIPDWRVESLTCPGLRVPSFGGS